MRRNTEDKKNLISLKHTITVTGFCKATANCLKNEQLHTSVSYEPEITTLNEN